jgi:DNA uptake protein ComE-like DNA-binding protein
VWVSATPFGLGAWTPMVPGVALRRPLWIGLGLMWALVAIAGWAAAIANDGGSGAGGLLILGWVGAIATTLAIRPVFNRAAGSAFSRDREAAERRLQERREAQQLALENPALAVELGVGRPDRPSARSAGLVDVNNAPLEALRLLPGIDQAKAMKIVRLREELNGFGSLHDLGAVLELDGHAVERLRDDTVFLPR